VAAGPGRGRRVLLGAAIAVTSALIVVAAVLLIRGPGEPPVTTTTDPTAQLRAEADAAARNFWVRLDEARAKNDVRKLEGLYVPGSEIEAGQRIVIERQIKKHEAEIVTARLNSVAVTQIDPSRVTVIASRTVTRIDARDTRTGRVRQLPDDNITRRWTMQFDRVDGHWLLQGLSSEVQR
jgi:hypothetical protein